MKVPWLPYMATEFLECRLLPRFRVFEWGSGGSTYWFSERCQRVISIEHDPARLIVPIPTNVEALLLEPESGEIGPDPSEPSHYRSGSTEVGPGRNWKRYATAIDAYDLFDVVLVDGMARASCISHAVPHVRPGGWLVIDNTGDRPYYLSKTINMFGNWDGGWERVTFFGRGPILSYLWETTMFRRPK